MDLFLKDLFGMNEAKPQYCLAFPLHSLCFADEEEAHAWLYFFGFLAVLPLALWLHLLLRRLNGGKLKAKPSKSCESPAGTPVARSESPGVLQTLHILTGILEQRRDLETKLKTLQNLNNSTYEGVGHRLEQKDKGIPSQ